MIFPFVLTDDSTLNDSGLGLTSDTTTSGGVIDGVSYELENISSSASGFTFSEGTGKTGDDGTVFTDTTENSLDSSTAYENVFETFTVLLNSVENSSGVEDVSNFVNTALESEIFSRAIESQLISPEILYDTSEFGFLTENAWIDEVAVSVVKGITADSIAWEGVDIHAKQSYNSNVFGQLAESSIKSISVTKNSTEFSELGESTSYIIDVKNQLSDGSISTEKLLLVSSASQSSLETTKSYEDRFVKTSTLQTSSEIGESYEGVFVNTSLLQAVSEIGKSYEDGSAKLEGRSEADELGVAIERRSVVTQLLYDILDESLSTDSLNMSVVTSFSSEHTSMGKDSSEVEFSIILSQDNFSTTKDSVKIEIDPSLGVKSTIGSIIKTFDIVCQMDNDVVITATFDMENNINTEI